MFCVFIYRQPEPARFDIACLEMMSQGHITEFIFTYRLDYRLWAGLVYRQLTLCPTKIQVLLLCNEIRLILIDNVVNRDNVGFLMASAFSVVKISIENGMRKRRGYKERNVNKWPEVIPAIYLFEKNTYNLVMRNQLIFHPLCGA